MQCQQNTSQMAKIVLTCVEVIKQKNVRRSIVCENGKWPFIVVILHAAHHIQCTATSQSIYYNIVCLLLSIHSTPKYHSSLITHFLAAHTNVITVEGDRVEVI